MGVLLDFERVEINAARRAGMIAAKKAQIASAAEATLIAAGSQLTTPYSCQADTACSSVWLNVQQRAGRSQ